MDRKRGIGRNERQRKSERCPLIKAIIGVALGAVGCYAYPITSPNLIHILTCMGVATPIYNNRYRLKRDNVLYALSGKGIKNILSIYETIVSQTATHAEMQNTLRWTRQPTGDVRNTTGESGNQIQFGP